MKILRNICLPIAALGMVVAPVAAQASVERSTASSEAESEMGGSGTILLVLAIAAIIAGIVIAVGGSDDPVSA